MAKDKVSKDKKSSCIKCSKQNKINNHALNPLLTPITYETVKIVDNLSLPRKYTSTHNDDTAQIFISVGSEYNKILLNTAEVRNVQSQILGKWNRKHHKYSIHFKAYISTEQNPQAELRNLIICKELGIVMQSVALAETALLNKYPKLNKTKIYVHFSSIDPKYDRIEYWNTLGYWK